MALRDEATAAAWAETGYDPTAFRRPLAQAIKAAISREVSTALKSSGVGTTKGASVASTKSKPTECPSCVERRKAKKLSMQRYRAKLAKKVKKTK